MDLDEIDRQCALRGWRMQELAVAAGVHLNTVKSLYRRGTAMPSLLLKLATAFESNPPKEVIARLMGEPTEAGAA